MNKDALSYAVASSVAIAVIISMTTPITLSSAGLASGFMGTVTSIGGPAMALVYKD